MSETVERYVWDGSSDFPEWLSAAGWRVVDYGKADGSRSKMLCRESASSHAGPSYICMNEGGEFFFENGAVRLGWNP